MTTTVRVDRDVEGRVRTSTRADHFSPRTLDRGPDGVRVALVATGALLLAGDDVVIEVDVAPGVALEIVETSGTVAYDMRGGRASWSVVARVGAGGCLTWSGLPFVVSAGAVVTRRTTVVLDDGATALLRETVVLGRSNETGGDLLVSTDVRRPDGRPLLREDLDLSRSARGDDAVLGDARVLDSVTLLGARLDLDGPEVLQLAEPGTIVRSLTSELHESTLDTLVAKCFQMEIHTRIGRATPPKH